MNPQISRFYIYIKPFAKNKLVKTYSSIVFSLIAMSIFAIFAIRPTVLTILELQKSIDEQKQTLKKLEKKEHDLELIKTTLQKIDPQTKTNINNLLPDNPALPKLMDVISNLSNVNQASVSGLQFQPTTLNAKVTDPVGIGKITNIEFTTNLRGSFSNLVNLLQTLNTASRLIKITNVNFNKPETQELIISVSAVTFYIKY